MNETHPSVSVPRTVAMALSTALVNFFDEMAIKNGFYGMVATTPGVSSELLTYEGKLVDKLIRKLSGLAERRHKRHALSRKLTPE